MFRKTVGLGAVMAAVAVQLFAQEDQFVAAANTGANVTGVVCRIIAGALVVVTGVRLMADHEHNVVMKILGMVVGIIFVIFGPAIVNGFGA